jgi:predicted HNH restriction endonuclease
MPFKDLKKRKEKNAEYSKKYYADDKARSKLRTKATKQRNRAMWEEFKATLSCALCDETHPATFDFHHVFPDKKNIKIHKILTNGAFKKLPDELAKCIVLCANCHRKLHHDELMDKRKGAEAP